MKLFTISNFGRSMTSRQYKFISLLVAAWYTSRVSQIKSRTATHLKVCAQQKTGLVSHCLYSSAPDGVRRHRKSTPDGWNSSWRSLPRERSDDCTRTPKE